MTGIDLKTADRLANGVLEAGKQRQSQPLTVAVLDPGGHIVVVKRDDESGIMRSEIAFGKAWGALGMGLASRTLFERAKSAPSFFAALASASGGRMIPVPGGVLIRTTEGRLVGAVGVSGDTSDVDEQCAVSAIEAVGLVADTGVA
jgi:uncharacterized protein GlcG (DUF336 family)